jgi:hypothetical protein
MRTSCRLVPRTLAAWLSGLLLLSSPVLAQSAPAPEAEPPPSSSPAPYSVPWQLRPAAAATVVRWDTALAFMEGADGSRGTTVASMLLGSYKLGQFAPLVRVGLVNHSPPGGGAQGRSLLNPVLGGSYLLPMGETMRLTLFLGLTAPVGTGGGNTPDAAVAAANRAGILARSAMDNAMFAVNDFTVFPGVGFAYVAHGLSLQAEATVLQLTRVRGEDVQVDASRTNFTSGLSAGYFVLPTLSLATELRYQRWLSTPTAVADDPSLRHTLTVAGGARLHLELPQGPWLRPGLAYARGLNGPMARQKYNILQLDVVAAF